MRPLRVFAPSHYCGLGAGSIPLRAIVNKKQCETRGLFMSLVIHYWVGAVQDSQPLKWRILCQVGTGKRYFLKSGQVPPLISQANYGQNFYSTRSLVVMCCGGSKSVPPQVARASTGREHQEVVSARVEPRSTQATSRPRHSQPVLGNTRQVGCWPWFAGICWKMQSVGRGRGAGEDKNNTGGQLQQLTRWLIFRPTPFVVFWNSGFPSCAGFEECPWNVPDFWNVRKNVGLFSKREESVR